MLRKLELSLTRSVEHVRNSKISNIRFIENANTETWMERGE